MRTDRLTNSQPRSSACARPTDGPPACVPSAKAPAVAATGLSKRWRILGWIAIAAAFVALRIPFVSTPLERDEGVYAYMAQRVLEGGVPYRDVFDHKPPGVFLVYSAAFLIAGQSVESIHVAGYLFTLAAMILLYRLVARIAGPGAGLVSALALAVMTIDPSFLGSAANTEIFMIVPLTGAMLCLVVPSGLPSRRRIVAAGALGAAAFWFKPVAATDILFLGAWLSYLNFTMKPPRRSWSRWVRDLGLLATGGAAATAPVVIYFVARGAWAQFFYCVFTYNTIYATTNAPPMRLVPAIFWSNFRVMIAPLWPYMALTAVGLASLARRERATRVLLTGWLLFSFAGVCIGGNFREHYFIQALPAVAALVGVGAIFLVRRLTAVA